MSLTASFKRISHYIITLDLGSTLWVCPQETCIKMCTYSGASLHCVGEHVEATVGMDALKKLNI